MTESCKPTANARKSTENNTSRVCLRWQVENEENIKLVRRSVSSFTRGS